MNIHSSNSAYLLDDTDIRILAALQEDASLDNKMLARQVNLSPAPCLRRVKRLIDDGIIEQRVALLNATRIGLGVEVFAFVALESQRAPSGVQFENLLRRRPEVVECVRLSGSYDYLLRVIVASIDEYSTFIDKHLLPLPGIRLVNSNFALGILKRTTALPLPAATRGKHSRRERDVRVARRTRSRG
jgi:DNA-binding Lrp family transcriptional regulator